MTHSVLSTSPPNPSAGPDAEAAPRAERAAEKLTRIEAEAQHLRRKVREAPACLASLAGPEQLVTITNVLFRQLFGNRPLVGLPVRQALPELAGQPFFELLDQVYRTGATHYCYEPVVFLDATHAERSRPLHFTFIAQAVRDASGTVTSLLLFAYNVSAHVRAYQPLEARRKLGATAQQLALTNEKLAVANEELAVTTEELTVSNEELARTNDELFSANLALVLANEQLQASNQEIRAQADELQRAHLAVRELNTQLEDRVAERTAQLQDALRDTEQANTALKQSNHQLMCANEDLDSFVHAASHDLKLPVINLIGLFNELRWSISFANPEEERLLLPLVEQALKQLSAAIDDLAALGQAQQTNQEPSEPVCLKELVEEVLLTLNPQVRAACARIVTDFAIRPTLSYPRASLRTVLLNLLSNALKYADPERPARVRLALRLDADQLVLLVEDNGVGFNAIQHGAELFQLFRRFHTHVEGTGVGLYLVNRLVRANGGHIEVESQVGEGATFRVYLGQAWQ